MTLLDQALSYSARGLSIVPLRAGEKRPLISWKQFQDRRASDEEIRGWFSDPKITGIAVVLGPPSGRLFCRDFDIANSYDDWADKYSQWSPTMGTVKTARGVHVYGILPEDCPLSGIHQYSDGELRISGGICVVPPSAHPSGVKYQWIIPLPQSPLEIDPREIGMVGEPAVNPAARDTEEGNRIPSGARNKTLLSLGGSMRQRGMEADEIRAALTTANTNRCDPPLPEKEVDGIVTSVTKYDPADPHKQRTSEAVVVCMADVTPEKVEWLWQPFIPLGKLVLLEGDPEVGKTTLALQLAASVTQGYGWPDENGKPCNARPAANVVYLNAEDGLGDTIRPRLDRAGADVSRVYTVTGMSCGEGKKALNRGITLQDVDALDDVLSRFKPDLLIVDPLQAYLGPKVDMNKANETRPVLAGLAQLAEKHSCAVVCIRHCSKGQQPRAMYKGLGSIDFTAAARSVILIAEDKDNPHKRIVAHVKSSLAPRGQSLGFELSDGFQWTGPVHITADEINSPNLTEKESNGVDNAVAFIKEALAGGGASPKTVRETAQKRGISTWSLRKARDLLGVQTKKSGGEWKWSLPKNDRGEVQS